MLHIVQKIAHSAVLDNVKLLAVQICDVLQERLIIVITVEIVILRTVQAIVRSVRLIYRKWQNRQEFLAWNMVWEAVHRVVIVVFMRKYFIAMLFSHLFHISHNFAHLSLSFSHSLSFTILHLHTNTK